MNKQEFKALYGDVRKNRNALKLKNKDSLYCVSRHGVSPIKSNWGYNRTPRVLVAMALNGAADMRKRLKLNPRGLISLARQYRTESAL